MMLYLGVPCFHGYSVNEVLLAVAANKTKVYEMFKYVSAEWQELQFATCSAQMCLLLFLFHTTSSSTVLPPLQLSSLPLPFPLLPLPLPSSLPSPMDPPSTRQWRCTTEKRPLYATTLDTAHSGEYLSEERSSTCMMYVHR